MNYSLALKLYYLSALAGDYNGFPPGREGACIGGKRHYGEIQRGIAKGITQGITQGERLGVIKTLKELVTDKILTVSDAAKRAGMSVSDFKTAAGIVADR